MREIKFRALDKKGNVIREDIQVFYGSFWDILKDDNWVVMQFTGLLDKNGKEIYEGDIVSGHGWFQEPGNLFVSYIDSGFCLRKDENGIGIHIDPRTHNMAVVGNIYENPELIHKQKLA